MGEETEYEWRRHSNLDQKIMILPVERTEYNSLDVEGQKTPIDDGAAEVLPTA